MYFIEKRFTDISLIDLTLCSSAYLNVPKHIFPQHNRHSAGWKIARHNIIKNHIYRFLYVIYIWSIILIFVAITSYASLNSISGHSPFSYGPTIATNVSLVSVLCPWAVGSFSKRALNRVFKVAVTFTLRK